MEVVVVFNELYIYCTVLYLYEYISVNVSGVTCWYTDVSTISPVMGTTARVAVCEKMERTIMHTKAAPKPAMRPKSASSTTVATNVNTHTNCVIIVCAYVHSKSSGPASKQMIHVQYSIRTKSPMEVRHRRGRSPACQKMLLRATTMIAARMHYQ